MTRPSDLELVGTNNPEKDVSLTRWNTVMGLMETGLAVTPQQFGASFDNVTDDYAAFRNALDYLEDQDPASDGGSNGTLYVPPGRYYLSEMLSLHSPVRIRGEGAGMAGGRATQLRWPSGSAGIVVNYVHSDGYDAPIGGNIGTADGSIIEGLALNGGTENGAWAGGAAYDPDAEADGILLRGRAAIRDCQASYFQRNGMAVLAGSDGNPLFGNANCFAIERCRTTVNGLHGLHIAGTDANAGLVSLVDASFNRRWGINDESFLGTTLIGCHTDANGLGNGSTDIDSIVSWPAGGQRYAVVHGQEAAAATTEPGTDPDVWMECGDSIGGREWFSGITVRSGGGYKGGLLLGCYSEGGQGPSQLTTAIGGLHGSGFRQGLKAFSTSGSWLASVDVAQTLNDGTTREIKLGDSTAGDNLFRTMRHNGMTADAYWHERHQAKDIFAFMYGGGTIFRAGGVPDSGSFANAGTAGPLQLLFQANNLSVRIHDDANGDGRRIYYGSAAPTTGVHAQGEIVFNTGAAASGSVGWVCVTGGTPGTWKTFGAISA